MTTPQYELASPPSDAISAIQFAPTSLRLLVASWDKCVYHYDTSVHGGRLLGKHEHRAPVLDVCFGEDEDTAYSVGLDWDVRRISLSTSTQSVLSTHTAGVRSVVYARAQNILISASWDSTLHIHHLSSSTTTPAPLKINLPHKPFSLSLTPTKLVVAMASRALHIYSLSDLASPDAVSSSVEPWQRRESSLKFMTRAVACMPTDDGYASSSIEGRVAVEWFDPSPASQSRKYAFKCHRQASPEGVDMVYPVNALTFHPVHGSFASGGGDGFVALWDGVAKRRIRQYQRYQSSVSALSFSGDGRFLAVAVSPGFEDGREGVGEGLIAVFIRELGEGEAKGKGAK
ncbi:mitotic spindle checkpoint protein Bub3 [Lecanora helva]